MALLNITLEEGFSGEAVDIRVDGRELYHKPNVTTRLQTGYADSVETEVANTPTRIEIALPQKGLSKSILVDVEKAPYLRVSLSETGELQYRSQDSPHGYM